jgi:hypothetical protein
MTTPEHRPTLDRTVLQLDADEVVAVAELADLFAADDEQLPTGHVLLTAHDGRRTWIAGDGSAFAALRTTAPAPAFEVMVPRRAISFAVRQREDTSLELHHDGPTVLALTLTTTGAEFETDVVHPPDGRLRQVLALPTDPAATVRLDGATLDAVLDTATHAPTEVERGTEPLFWIDADDGRLGIEVHWDGLGASHYRVSGSGSGRARTAGVPLAFRRAFRPLRGEVELRFTEDPDGPISVIGDDHLVRMWPVRTTAERFRHDVEELVAEAFGPMAILRDADGDYPLRRHDIPIYARLIDGPPVSVQVFAVLLHDVEPSDGLLRELNDLNGSVSHARLVHVAGQVLAEADLVAGTIDVEELHAAARSISRIADDLVPALGALFGGTRPDPAGERWERRRGAQVLAELWPGRRLWLTGSEASEEWDLPAPLHFLTAWNPRGAEVPAASNQRANDALTLDVHAAGGALARAATVFADGTSADGFLVWDLDRETVCDLGRQYGQESVLAVDAERVTLVSCVDGRTETWARTGPA